jgi:monofunctional glycosyltransferase
VKLLGWIRRHPWKSVLLALGLFVIAEMASLPWFSVADLQRTNPGETALMVQRRREAESAGKRYAVKQEWIALSSLPDYVVQAIVVAEDGTFYTHHGFDWFEVKESLQKDLRQKRLARGGSTITQQVAKNLYLSTSKDPLRKAKEALITVMLERELGKNRILEIYLNIAEWGDGVFGIGAASRTFFHKPASLLTPAEALRLAAVIPSPLKHRPDADSKYVLRRSEIMRQRMLARHGTDTTITPEEDESSLPPDQLPGVPGSTMDTTDNSGI